MEKEKKTIKPKKYFSARGARKTSTCHVHIYKGQGDFTVNGKKYDQYFPMVSDRNTFLSPLVLTGHLADVDLMVKINGGGIHSQAGACRHGISRALILLDPALRPALKAEGYLTRDPRMKERKKPGLKRARRAPQWSKR